MQKIYGLNISQLKNLFKMKQQDRLFLLALTLFVFSLFIFAINIIITIKTGNTLSFFDKNTIWIYGLVFWTLWLIPDRK